MLPILKIPFILATTLALHIGYTRPNPPPPESERPKNVNTTMSDRFIGLSIQYFAPFVKVGGVGAIIIVIVRGEASLSDMYSR